MSQQVPRRLAGIIAIAVLVRDNGVTITLQAEWTQTSAPIQLSGCGPAAYSGKAQPTCTRAWTG